MEIKHAARPLGFLSRHPDRGRRALPDRAVQAAPAASSRRSVDADVRVAADHAHDVQWRRLLPLRVRGYPNAGNKAPGDIGGDGCLRRFGDETCSSSTSSARARGVLGVLAARNELVATRLPDGRLGNGAAAISLDPLAKRTNGERKAIGHDGREMQELRATGAMRPLLLARSLRMRGPGACATTTTSRARGGRTPGSARATTTSRSCARTRARCATTAAATWRRVAPRGLMAESASRTSTTCCATARLRAARASRCATIRTRCAPRGRAPASVPRTRRRCSARPSVRRVHRAV